ncbi:MAG: DUF4097 family beta strand repeat-containing protein [Acidobacteriota bacterium]
MRFNSRLRAAVVSALALSVLGFGGVVVAEEIDREFHETFQVEPGMRLQLYHGDGNVTITPWDQDNLDVLVRYRATVKKLVGWSKHDDLDVTFKHDGDTIKVVGTDPSMVSIGFSAFKEYEYSYTVRAPSYLRLELIGDDGDVAISDWRADLELHSNDGDMRLTSIESQKTEIRLDDGDLEILGFAGELRVETADGDVEIRDCVSSRVEIQVQDGDVHLIDCRSDVEVRGDDGDIRLSKLRAEAVDIKTADGDVTLDLLPSENLDLDLRVADGDVVVEIDQAISAAFDLSTRDGRIRVDGAAIQDLQKTDRRATGRFGDGSGSIQISSSDGNITLRQ